MAGADEVCCRYRARREAGRRSVTGGKGPRGCPGCTKQNAPRHTTCRYPMGVVGPGNNSPAPPTSLYAARKISTRVSCARSPDCPARSAICSLLCSCSYFFKLRLSSACTDGMVNDVIGSQRVRFLACLTDDERLSLPSRCSGGCSWMLAE